MPRKKIITTIYLNPEQEERLKGLSQNTRVPMSVYIREGIDLVLEKNRLLLRGQLELQFDKHFDSK